MNDGIVRYLARQEPLKRPVHAPDVKFVQNVVAIPVLAENDAVDACIASFAQNPRTYLDRTLLLFVVNNRADALSEHKADNQRTLEKLRDRSAAIDVPRIAYIDAASPGHELPAKQGVGLARKLGLDWGLALFHRSGVHNAALCSADADTLVEPDYLEAIGGWRDKSDAWGAIVDFAHQPGATPEEIRAITEYELFLRYHVLGLASAGSPYAYHAMGSAMICTPQAYAAVAGMARRQAGEDFYFLQKLAKTGPIHRIDSTTVHPSARPSWRVPFGTGRRVTTRLREEGAPFLAYHPGSYAILGAWLAHAGRHITEGTSPTKDAGAIAEPLAAFLEAQQFESAWEQICRNANSVPQRLAQFHRWFDAFRTLKLMHFLRDNGYTEWELPAAATHLLESLSGENAMPLDGATLHGLLAQARDCEGRLCGVAGIY